MNLLFQLNKSMFKTIFRNFQEFERKRKKNRYLICQILTSQCQTHSLNRIILKQTVGGFSMWVTPQFIFIQFFFEIYALFHFFFCKYFLSLSESSRSFLEPLLLHCNKDEDQFSHLPRNHSPNKTIKNYYNWQRHSHSHINYSFKQI